MTAPRIEKAALLAALVAELRDARERMLSAQKTSAQGVTHADAKSEGDKDMRATEASYVARGQAMRVEALDAEIAKVAGMYPRELPEGAKVGLGALVTLEEEAGERLVLVAPGGGGTVLTLGDTRIHVVTPSSPLGRALVGMEAGDVVQVPRGGAEDEVTVVAVR